MISEKQVEDASKKVNNLINEARYFLIIPRKTQYDTETLGTICEKWNEAFNKIEQAKEIILEMIGQSLAEIPSSLKSKER